MSGSRFNRVFVAVCAIAGAVILVWTGYLIAHPPNSPTPPAVVVFP